LKKKEEILLQIAQRIKAIREEKNISQIELARLTDKERQNIYRLEKGKINPSIFQLYEIANSLEMNLSDLLKDIK